MRSETPKGFVGVEGTVSSAPEQDTVTIQSLLGDTNNRKL
jgi:hypothetical protein